MNTDYVEERVHIDVVIAMLRRRQAFVMKSLQLQEHDLPWDFDQVERFLRDPGPIPVLHRSAGQLLNREQASLSLAHAVRNTSVFVRGPEELQLVVYVVIDLELRPDLAFDDPLDEKYVWTKFWDIDWHQRELALIQLRLFSSSGTPPVDTEAFLKQFEMEFAAVLVPELAGVENWGQVSSDVLRPNWGHGCSLLQMLRLRYGIAFSRAVEATPTYQALNRLWHAVLWNADPWTSAQLLALVNFHESGAQGLLRLGPRNFRCDPIADRAREFDDLADDISREQARAMLVRRERYEAKLAVEALRRSQPLPELPPDWVDAAGAPLTKLYAGNFPVFYGMGTIEPEGMDNVGNHFAGQVNGMLGTAVAPLLHFNTGLHTGKVHLAIWLAESEPPLPPEAWDELVEAPYHVEPGSKLYLRDWEGALAKRLRLPAGSYRVRMGAARMGQAQNWPDGRDKRQRPIERYALAFWPAPQQPDAVLREACSFAKDGHDLTRERSEEAAREQALAHAGELA